jgi:hypothetical protein
MINFKNLFLGKSLVFWEALWLNFVSYFIFLIFMIRFVNKSLPFLYFQVEKNRLFDRNSRFHGLWPDSRFYPETNLFKNKINTEKHEIFVPGNESTTPRLHSSLKYRVRLLTWKENFKTFLKLTWDYHDFHTWYI